MTFEIVSTIADIETLAVGRAIPELPRLKAMHGGGRWRKRYGVATVRLADGSYYEAEIHWYEAHSIGPKEVKIRNYWKEGHEPPAKPKTIRLVRP